MSQIIYGNQVNDTDVSVSITAGTVTSYADIDRTLNRSIIDAFEMDSISSTFTVEYVHTSTFEDFEALCFGGIKSINPTQIKFLNSVGSTISTPDFDLEIRRNRGLNIADISGDAPYEDIYQFYPVGSLTGVKTIQIVMTRLDFQREKWGSLIVGNFKEINFSLKGVNLSSISTSKKKYSDGRQLYYTSNPLVFKGTFNSVALPSLDVWGTSIDSLSNINYIHDTTGLLIIVMSGIDNICLYGTQSQGMKFKAIEGNDSTGEKMWQASFSIEEEL